MAHATLSTKGWIVIPSEFRRKYGWIAGTRLTVVDYGGVLALVHTPDNPVDEALGMLKGKSSLLQALRDVHEQELADEDPT